MGLPGRENTWGKCRHMIKKKEERRGQGRHLEPEVRQSPTRHRDSKKVKED